MGEYIKGTVSRLVDFGAFVDLGGVDGLIHVSEVSWKRVRKPSDVLVAGQEVKALIIAVDPEKNKISLSLKSPESNPWSNAHEKYPVGEIIEGTVVRLAPFGAFISLEDGIDGLVHISQIADKHVAKPDDELTPGQVIKIKVMDIDAQNQKISLSKREADAVLFSKPEEEPAGEDEVAAEAEPPSEDVANADSDSEAPSDAEKNAEPDSPAESDSPAEASEDADVPPDSDSN